MKKLLYILLLASLFGCEKVIEVDLNDVHPAIVIEGNLTVHPNIARVKISKTANYFGQSEPEKVSGASVVIISDEGDSVVLHEANEGLYETQYIYPRYGQVFTLKVEVEGQKYEAVSKLNRPVRIDSLTAHFEEGFAFFQQGYYLKMNFADPANIPNYYRLKVYKNDKYKNNITNLILFDDRISDGLNLEVRLVQRVYKVGQEARVELISLDKGAYEYYKTFQELINANPGSAAPANPTSNISNGALGYFSAWSKSSASIVISE